jgi:hypothetical protein
MSFVLRFLFRYDDAVGYLNPLSRACDYVPDTEREDVGTAQTPINRYEGEHVIILIPAFERVQERIYLMYSFERLRPFYRYRPPFIRMRL